MSTITFPYSPPEKLNRLVDAVQDKEGIELTVGLRPAYPELVSAIENPETFDVSCIELSGKQVPALRSIITKPLSAYDKKIAHSLALLVLCSRYRVKPFQHLIFENGEPKIEYSGYDFGYLTKGTFERFCNNPAFFVGDKFKWFGIAFRDFSFGNIAEAQKAVKKFVHSGYIVREAEIRARIKDIVPKYQGRSEDKLWIRAIRDTLEISGDFVMNQDSLTEIRAGIESFLK